MNYKQIIGGNMEGEKWIKHYSSKQKILLIGEGDFSFALSLATAFGNATNIVATSIDSPGLICFLFLFYCTK